MFAESTERLRIAIKLLRGVPPLNAANGVLGNLSYRPLGLTVGQVQPAKAKLNIKHGMHSAAITSVANLSCFNLYL